MFAQSKFELNTNELEAFNDKTKAEIKQKISHPFLVKWIFDYDNKKVGKIKKTIEANKNKSGYTVNETPKNTGNKLFETIMKKYKGKIVFVDFWATWCGPCRNGIKKMKTLKNKLKDKNIQFVYITNQSSPKKNVGYDGT